MAEGCSSDKKRKHSEALSSDSDAEDKIISVLNDKLDLNYESESEPLSDEECEVNATLNSDWIHIDVTIDPRRAPVNAATPGTSTLEPAERSSISRGSVHASEILSTGNSSSQWTTQPLLAKLPFISKSEKYNIPDLEKPEDYFNFFFSDKLLDTICKNTNSKTKRLAERFFFIWKPLTPSELRRFIGMLIHMGTVALDDVNDYWNIDRILVMYNYEKLMFRYRFLLILKYLTFSDKLDDDDPLHRVETIIVHFNEIMKQSYSASRKLILEEGMILRRGRLRFSQFVTEKKGIRLSSLTEPDGLTLKLHVHAGRADPTGSGESLSERLAMYLLRDSLDIGRSVYMDSWYSSVTLSEKLLENYTYSTGLLRINRKGNPKEVVRKTLMNGKNISMYKDGVHVGMWKHKGEYVPYITTEFDDTLQSVQVARGRTYTKPQALVELNRRGSAAERQELVMSYYPCEKIAMRWDLKVAIHVFHLMLINSFLLYKKRSGLPDLTFYNYRLLIIKMLIPTNDLEFDGTMIHDPIHELMKRTEKTLKGKSKIKDCRQCLRRKRRTGTVWYCGTCPSKPPLCVTCFKTYHMYLLTQTK